GDRPQGDRPYNDRNAEARPAVERPAGDAPVGNRAERGVTRPKFNNRYERRDNRQGGGRFDRRPRRDETVVPFEDRKSGPRVDPNSPAADAFIELGVSKVLAQLLFANSITDPTPIQTLAIPVVLQGGDTIGIAQTGTGKTLAFGVPTLMRLTQTGQALILAPTRELAMQIDSALRFVGATSALLIGGAPMDRQVRALAKRPKLIIGTPGRVQDHLRQGTFGLRNIEIAILDEADRMLDMGFVTAIREVLNATPAECQTLLFSATMAPEVMNITREFLTEPTVLEVPRETLTADTVDQELIVVDHEQKAHALSTLLSNEQGTVLVFARTRHGARKLAKSINDQGHTAAEIHSDRTLAQRITALNGFKSGLFRVLVATDIAARGIDVKGISLVVNYDIPECAEDYVHRIGRTGRAGARGRAITIATPAQKRDVWDIEKLISMKLDRSELSQGEIGDFVHKSRGGARQQRQRTWNRR
ncbi:MAG TPA: DEAD/DEAH box helicase, partial [Fimbriimonas sp.]|nr:DEAD/DEAH box helicase [Fimbriimonas sp.]